MRQAPSHSRYITWLICAWLCAPSPIIAAERLTIYVVNYPLQYFAERIAGEHAEVVLPVPPAVDPAYWMPDAATVAAYQRADLILLNGAQYAKWLSKVSLPQFRLVDTSAGFGARYIRRSDTVTHTHGPQGKHAHTDVAFTTWLDFDLAAQHAKAVADALSRLRPALRDTFQRRYIALAKDLQALDQAIHTVVAQQPTLHFIASHPVYDYLARRYQLEIQSVHWEPDAVPSPAQWEQLSALRRTYPAAWMIWEAKPAAETVTTLTAMGITILVFDPCANVPERGDFLSVMRHNVANLTLAFR
jgi:zinc transport system substrate-binding protein